MRIEVWTAPKCAGGVFKALLQTITSAIIETQTDNYGRLAIVAGPNVTTEVSELRIARVTDDVGVITEWSISDITDAHDEGEPVTNIMCDPLLVLFATTPVHHTITGGRTYYNNGLVNSTAGNLIATWVIPALAAEGFSWVSIGTIEPTTRFDLAWERWSVLELLNQIAARTMAELVLRRNGDSGYLIDLLEEQGSNAELVLMRPDRNLISLTRSRRSAPLRTVVIPTGGAPSGDDNELSTIAWNAWRISAISGNDLTIEDPDGGPAPIRFANQLNGLYVQKPDATLTQITDSTTAQVITVASATGLAIGDHVQIRADSDGTLLTELTNPAAIAAYDGKRITGRPDNPSLRGERNHVPNAYAEDWTQQSMTQGFENCFVNGGVSGSTVPLHGLPPTLVISPGDLIIFADTSQRIVNTGGTVAGDGTVSITTTVAPSAFGHDTHVRVCASTVPTDYVRTTLQLAKRDVSLAAATLTGALVGAHTDARGFTVDGLTPGEKVEVGDRFSWGALPTTNNADIIKGGTVDGSGVLVVQIHAPITGTVADNTAVRLIRLNHGPLEGGASGIALPAIAHTTVVPQGYITTPSIKIRYAADLPVVWAHARLTYTAPAGAGAYTLQAGAGSGVACHPASLLLIDAVTSATLASVQGQDRPLALEGVAYETLRTTCVLTADTELELRVIPINRNSAGSALLMSPWTIVRWVMLTIGSDQEVPPILGSHANAIWHLGNDTLADTSGSPISYTARAIDLERMGVPYSALVLGGTCRVMDTELGIDTELRIVALKVDLIDPLQTEVTFARLSPRLTKKLATRRQRQFVQVNIANTADSPTAAPEVITAPATLEAPVDLGVDGTVRGGTPKGNEGSVGVNDLLPVQVVSGTRFLRFVPE